MLDIRKTPAMGQRGHEIQALSSARQKFSQVGISVYAFGSFAAGVFDLLWRNFDAAHQPLQAWGNKIPGAAVFACITGACMAAGSIALLWRRSKRAGGTALSAIYFLFALFWVPRFYTVPHFLGFRIPVLIGVFSGMASQLIASAAGALLWGAPEDPSRQRAVFSIRGMTGIRWIIGICAIGFGLGHLTDIRDNLVFVPKWMPPGAEFWVIVTGICFVLAGLAIVTQILDVLAAWLLGLMFLVFNVTILPGFIIAHPMNHAAWGGNAYNLAAAGSAWIFAQSIAEYRTQPSSDPRTKIAEPR